MTYLNVAQLKERGWSGRLIRSLLGSPDDNFVPVATKSGRPQRMYLLSRVIEAESCKPEFTAAQSRRGKFADRSKKQIEAKAEQLKNAVDDYPLPDFPDSYEALLFKVHSNTLGSKLLQERLALPDLIASMDSLNDVLDLYKWHSGIGEARPNLKRRVLAYIVNRYPILQRAADIELADTEAKGCAWAFGLFRH